MFRTIILSIAMILGFASISTANVVDYNKAYRVIHNRTTEVLSDISFEPKIEWVNGNPYVSMKEFDRMGRQHMELYSYHDIILEPIDAKNIMK